VGQISRPQRPTHRNRRSRLPQSAAEAAEAGTGRQTSGRPRARVIASGHLFDRGTSSVNATPLGLGSPRQRRCAPGARRWHRVRLSQVAQMRPPTAASRIRATSVIRPAQLGHASTSKPKLRSMSSAQARLGRRRTRPRCAHAWAGARYIGAVTHDRRRRRLPQRRARRQHAIVQDQFDVAAVGAPPCAPRTPPVQTPTASSRPPTGGGGPALPGHPVRRAHAPPPPSAIDRLPAPSTSVLPALMTRSPSGAARALYAAARIACRIQNGRGRFPSAPVSSNSGP
jgi:hypothetical protein